MAFNQALADRIRRVLAQKKGLSEKQMFGGVAFLLQGKMFCGIVKDDLMVRVGPAHYEAALGKAHVRPMDFTGRPMKGYVFVDPEGCADDKALRDWITRGLEFVRGSVLKGKNI